MPWTFLYVRKHGRMVRHRRYMGMDVYVHMYMVYRRIVHNDSKKDGGTTRKRGLRGQRRERLSKDRLLVLSH